MTNPSIHNPSIQWCIHPSVYPSNNHTVHYTAFNKTSVNAPITHSSINPFNHPLMNLLIHRPIHQQKPYFYPSIDPSFIYPASIHPSIHFSIHSFICHPFIICLSVILPSSVSLSSFHLLSLYHPPLHCLFNHPSSLLSKITILRLVYDSNNPSMKRLPFIKKNYIKYISAKHHCCKLVFLCLTSFLSWLARNSTSQRKKYSLIPWPHCKESPPNPLLEKNSNMTIFLKKPLYLAQFPKDYCINWN